MRLPLSIISLSLLAACEGAQLKEGGIETARGSAAAAAEVYNGQAAPSEATQVTNPAPVAVDNTPSEAAPTTYSSADAPMPEAAYMPVSIGGASLTCSVVANDTSIAKCFAKNAAGQPYKFAATKAFFIDSKNLFWVPTNFFETTTGNWTVKLPQKIDGKSFAISLADEANTFMLDWIANTADPLAQALADGSFEAVLYDGTITSQMLDTAHQKSWKAIAKTSGCQSVIEMANGSTMPGMVASHGSQWIELDSVCQANSYLSGGNNTVVYQDLKLKIDHVYEITFQYMGRPGASQKQELQVRFGGDTALKTVVTASSWQTHKFLWKASKEQVRIEFEESGASDGTGTLLDNVMITDAGIGPK